MIWISWVQPAFPIPPVRSIFKIQSSPKSDRKLLNFRKICRHCLLHWYDDVSGRHTDSFVMCQALQGPWLFTTCSSLYLFLSSLFERKDVYYYTTILHIQAGQANTRLLTGLTWFSWSVLSNLSGLWSVWNA